MAENFDLVYGPIFRLQSVPATLTPRGAVAGVDMKALDDTAGVLIEDAETLLPVARIRARDLDAAGFTTEDLDRGTIALNGRTWRIERAGDEPTPAGRAPGMIMLVLSASA